MLMPSIFGGNMWDDFFGTPFDSGSHSGHSSYDLMSTDVKETADSYEIIMNLPGFSKENIKGEVKDGYLVVSASTNSSNDTKDEDGRYIRRERYSGSCSRSFYIGEEVTQEDIKAKFEDGTLRLTVPKKDPEKRVEEKHYIAIEG